MSLIEEQGRSDIIRSWSRSARQANFRNFRFYPVLVFALFCTLAPIAFVFAVIARLVLGYNTGTAGAPAIMLLFVIAGVIFYFGQKALRLKDGGGPFWMAFIFAILGCAITFADRAGKTAVEALAIGPFFLAMAIVSILAGFWLIEPRAGKARQP